MNWLEATREARRELQARSVDQILASLDRVADRFADPSDPLRQRAVEQIHQATGLARPMVAEGLTDQVNRIRGIGDLLDADLGSRYALDRFVDRAPGLKSRAFGPALLTCVFSGNVPGIPAFDMALALALKGSCLARPPKAEPYFAGIFKEAVAEVDEILGANLLVERWAHDDPAPYQAAEAVIAYGSDRSIDAIRRLVPPGTPFLGHGSRISFALICREAATVETARQLARDVAWYDQQGCVSPQIAFIERGGPLSPVAFAQAVGEELARLAVEWPRAPLTLYEAAALRRERDEAEWSADALFAPATGLDWAVIHAERPRFHPSPLGRFLRTFAIDEAAAVPLAGLGPLLQTVSVAAPAERRLAVAEVLGRHGASRICPVGGAQRLHPAWHHDGRVTAAALVRWVDVEG
jgi:acyl-CoA reductase-like NAD-dependent aldehyde dehydrogenase